MPELPSFRERFSVARMASDMLDLYREQTAAAPERHAAA